MSTIQDKSRAFAIRVINCYRYLTPEEYEELYSECRKLTASIMNFIKEIKSSEMAGSKYKPKTS